MCLDECVVACRYISGLENIGKLHELCPLNVSVAFNTGIRCQAFKISINKRRNYLLPEKRCAVMRMVSDIQYLTDASGFIDLTTPAVALFFRAPGAERNANNFIALLLQK